MDIKEQILVALGLNKSVKLAWQAKSEDGTIFVSTAESLEAGVDVSVLTEDGTTILLPIGTYTTDTGVSFRVETEGVVAEVMESETEEVVTVEEETMADVGDWEGMEKRIQNLEDAVADLKRAKVGGDDAVEMADEEATEEVVTEVVEKVEEAVEEIAAAIDEATPAEVTPELAAKAAEVAIEVMQDKAEDVAEDAEGETDMKKKEDEYSKFSKMEKELNELREKLNNSPADKPVNTNKFSSNRRFATLSKKEYKRLSSKDKFLYDLHR
jgi:hypothetical protein